MRHRRNLPSRRSQHVGSIAGKRRSSRRIQGLPPPTTHSAPKDLYLPTELRVYILSCLEKCDLKRVRLVSKEWCSLATTPLFDRAYISPRRKDIEVFEGITRHPVLSSAVRELVYDASQFVPCLDVGHYHKQLYDSMLGVSLRGGNPLSKISNAEIKRYVREQRAKALTCFDFCQRHKKDKFVIEGYGKYNAQVKYEQHSFQSGMFSSDLHSGLYRLENLRSVKLSDSIWNHELDQTPDEGSPLIRSWGPYYLHPTLRCQFLDADSSQMTDHFCTLTRAISTTGKNITNFEVPYSIGTGIPFEALRRPLATFDLLRQTLNAYSGLKSLELMVTTFVNNETVHDVSLPVLTRLLEEASSLQRLDLSLCKFNWGDFVTPYYSFEQVFPYATNWPNLTEIHISGLAINGLDLIQLIQWRTRVRSLFLAGIDLLKGTWEGVIEGLRFVGLIEFGLQSELTHCGGAIFKPVGPGARYPSTEPKILEAIEQYVIYGGRHPCLPPDGDPETALGWYLDMFSEDELKKITTAAREFGTEVPRKYRRI